MNKLMPLVAIVLLASGCRTMHELETEDSGQIVFGSSFAELKSSFAEDFSSIWKPEDIIGIYGLMDGFSIGSNALYRIEIDPGSPSHARFLSVSGALKWAGKGKYTFYAYSPYSTEGADPRAMPFSIPVMQSQKAGGDLSGFADYDIITARAEVEYDGKSPGAETAVDFTFRHLFCIVRLDVKPDAGTSGKRIVKAVLTSDGSRISGKGTFNMETEECTADNDGAADIILGFEQPPLLSEEKTSLYFVCLPSKKNTGLKVSLTLDDGEVMAFDYSDVKLESNSRVCLNAEAPSDGSREARITFPAEMSFACIDTRPAYMTLLGNTAVFSNGITLARRTEELAFIGNTENPAISSRNWNCTEAYIITVPLAETYSGNLEMSFRFIPRGLANWRADWSPDGENWRRGTVFSMPNSTLAYDCKAYFDIPQTEAVPAGGCLYLRLKPADTTACIYGGLTYFNADTDPRLLHFISLKSL